MPYQIKRNPAGNCINIVGATVPVYWNACLSAEVSPEDPDRINVINNIQTGSGSSVYELFFVPYTDFIDSDGVAYASAADLVDDFNSKANSVGDTGTYPVPSGLVIDFFLNSTRTAILTSQGDAFPLGSIRFIEADASTIDMTRHSGGTAIYSGMVTSGVTINGESVAGGVQDVIQALNALATGSGVSFAAPDLSGVPTSVDVVAGVYFNWQAFTDPAASTATEFVYSGLPSTVFVSQVNRGSLFGTLTAGTYPVTVTAFNAFGSSSVVVTFNSSAASAFDDTKSFEAEVNVFARSTDGAALALVAPQAAAWSCSFWVKTPSSSSPTQNVAVWGQALDSQSRVNLIYDGGAKSIRVRVGAVFDDYIDLETPANSAPKSTWVHVLVCWDGLGLTSSDFSVYINGALQALSVSDSSGSPVMAQADELRVGRCINDNLPLKFGLVNELALWASDESSNAAAIYSAGATHDLSLLAPPPDAWWRMGDGDTFPVLSGSVGSIDLDIVNGTPDNIVLEAP